MSSIDSEALFQLKIDFLQFMTQVQDWHDSNIIIIVYALLMEHKRITQSHLIELTGLGRSTISETLSLLINDPRGIPVLQTRKRGDNQKYYYCPLPVRDYIKKIFGGALNTINFSLEFISPLMIRLSKLTPQNESILHLDKFFKFFHKYNHMVRVVIGKYETILTDYFENPDKTPELLNYISEDELHLDVNISVSSDEQLPEKDSLENIIRDFIKQMIDLGQTSSSGTNKELAYAFFLLFLSKEPITQDDLIKITHSRRAAVSEAFSLLVRQKFATLVKKPNDRKNYYEPRMSLEAFLSSRLQLSGQKINQIELVINNRFIPEVEKLSINDRDKSQLKSFFQEIAFSFQILGRYMSDMFTFILKQLN